MKFINWNGEDLIGNYSFSVKLDGIQIRKKDGIIVSKNEKQLYNLSHDERDWEIAEAYTGDRGETWGIISASKSKRRQIKTTEIYPLFPTVCKQLYIGYFTDPTVVTINMHLARAIKSGFEGLVLRGGTVENPILIKVKKNYSEDVPITGMVEGKGKFKGMMGKLVTDQGEVGTGFSEAERKKFWRSRKKLIGTVVEVLFQEKTKKGLMRDPRFVRLREDK